MLFNRLLSLAAFFSIAAHALAAPIPMLNTRETEIEALGFEFEAEREGGKTEVEIERDDTLDLEAEITEPSKSRRLAVRSHPTRSLSASVLDAQKQLDVLSPQIEIAMQGMLGSIEKKVGAHLTDVDGVVHTLEANLKLFVGDKDEILYQNPEGTGRMTDAELGKLFSVFFLSISDMEEEVRHVSGYTVTSALLNIRNDLLSMKKTLGTLVPVVRTNVANNMAMALSMGTGSLGTTV